MNAPSLLTPLPIAPPYTPTQLERRMYGALESLGIRYQPQQPFGYYTVDGYVPSAHLAIEADGDVWHCCPECYGDDPNPDGAPAAYIRQRQATRDAWLRKRWGLHVVHLWGHDLQTQEQALATVRHALEPFHVIDEREATR